MRRVLILLIAVGLGWGVKAQCPLQTAVDFTATDVHGTEVHLFDILDGGQYVLIDFFFTTCSGCIQTVPFIVESYSLFGCNQHDVFYLEIDSGDTDAACLNWVNRFGIEYPTVGGRSGGTAICNQYGIGSYPTIILIAPDRSILIHDLWPIYSAQDVINALEGQGVEQFKCTEAVEENAHQVPSLCPNPANDFVTLKGEQRGTVLVYNVLGQKVDELETQGNELQINTTGYSNGVYFVKTSEYTLRFVVTH